MARERLVSRPSLESLFNDKIINKEERNKKVYEAHIDYGYSMSEIAKTINLHYTSVSVIINKASKKVKPYN